MATYHAPKLTNAKILLVLLVGGSVFFAWLIQAQPYDRFPALMFSLLWYGSLFLAWWWHRCYVKTIEVTDHIWLVVTQGGKTIRYSIDDIEQVRVSIYLGYREAVVSLKAGQTIRFTDHMPDFNTVLALLGVPTAQQESASVNKTIRKMWMYLSAFGVVSIVSVAMGLQQSGRTATLLYAGAGMSLLVCIIGFWIIVQFRRPSHHKRARSGDVQG